MTIWTPTTRISLGMVSLTICILLLAQWVGFVPDKMDSELAARKQISESLAMQLSWGAARNDTRLINSTIKDIVKRNDRILSVALRKNAGEIIGVAGEHDRYWDQLSTEKSTPDRIQVPIYNKNVHWGRMEVSFEPLQPVTGMRVFKETLLGLILFLSVVGFLFYSLFLRRALAELDPSSVIPERVKAAFDALAEGVVIVDEHEQIMLANNSFARQVSSTPAKLVGQRASSLDWQGWNTKGRSKMRYPWRRAIHSGTDQHAVPLLMRTPSGDLKSFMVNSSAIKDGKGVVRGALATFDDVTDLEKKNSELQNALSTLEKTKQEISRQNKELEFLATRDPLTGCLNRRAFIDSFEPIFEAARSQRTELCALMVDIDHFKLINDNYGHAVGDKVIKFVASTLLDGCRDEDLVARYGGEEFCIVMPGVDLAAATKAAERIRQVLQQYAGSEVESATKVTVTASLGVSSLHAGAELPADLVNQADMALYSAKESGRNRVVCWGDTGAIKVEIDGNEEPTFIGAKDTFIEEDAVGTGRTGEIKRLKLRVQELEEKTDSNVKASMTHGEFDQLSGFLNAYQFIERVSKVAAAGALGKQRSLSLLNLKVHDLERIADNFGATFGDSMLAEVASRIRAVLENRFRREDDVMIGRLHNDEFSIALVHSDDLRSIQESIEALLAEISLPIAVGGHKIHVSASVGASTLPDDTDEVDDLIRFSRTARRSATDETSRYSFHFYVPEMSDRGVEQLRMESQLRQAIDEGGLALHFQPVWDLSTGKISSVESLVRWNHPDHGLISPRDFLAVAESTGMIVELGEWVLRNACLACRSWRDLGIADVPVSVNLSPVQLRNGDLFERIKAILAESGLSPEDLELELTESTLMENLSSAASFFEHVAHIGIKTAIDDFGTGFASLDYLKRFPVNRLKLSRRFISDLGQTKRDGALVKGVISLGHQMNVRVVAEGVESEEQLQLLRRMGCDEAQGFLFGRPEDGAAIQQALLRYAGAEDTALVEQLKEPLISA